jgi:YfiR/HmsC-like
MDNMNAVIKFGAHWLLVLCAAIFFGLVVPLSCVAQEIPVPVQLHVVLLKKVFSLSKTLQGKQLKVVIVFSDASTLVKDEALNGFIAIGIQATACKIQQLGKEAEDADVIYIAPGAGAAQKFCEDHGILSITGMPSLTETGKSSVAIGVESGKPKVFINLPRARAEKQEFSSDLFKVAKVFQ